MVNKTNAVLRVGKFEPTFAEELALRYDVPSLPDGRDRATFLGSTQAMSAWW